MNEYYLQVLESRLEYFKGKPISELSDAEIKEYLALREEVQGLLTDVKEAMELILKPYTEALVLYSQRVKEKTSEKGGN